MLSDKVVKIFEKDKISLRAINQTVKDSSIGFVLALLSLPSALPIPAPGYSVPFGIAIIFIGGQVLIGRHTIWLPQSWQDKQLCLKSHKKMLNRIMSFIIFFESHVKTRSTKLFKKCYRLFGVIIIVCGISMIIPLPATNTIPALATFVFGLSFIENDSIAALFACIIAFIGILFTTIIIFWGTQALNWFLGGFLAEIFSQNSFLPTL